MPVEGGVGLYSTVRTVLVCDVCGASYPDSVQFKTGDDYGLPTYDEGETVERIDPGANYQGIASRHCIAAGADWRLSFREDLTVYVDEEAKIRVREGAPDSPTPMKQVSLWGPTLALLFVVVGLPLLLVALAFLLPWLLCVVLCR